MKRKRISLQNKKAVIIAIVAGILLLISGVNGVATLETIRQIIAAHILDNNIVETVFAVLIFIASLGGLSVIAGGLLLGVDRIRTGKFLVSLGAGLGVLGLIFLIIVTYQQGDLVSGGFFSIGTIGLILSIVARIAAKK